MTPEFFYNLLSQIVVGGAIAVIASKITVKLSLNRFVTEKWWEKKAEAYAAILESLHHMKRSFEEDFDAFIEGREVPDERQKVLKIKFRAAYDELLKRIDIGHFILSDSAVDELSSFRKRYEKAGGDAPGDYFAYLDEGLFSINSALAKMRLEAKHDLK